MVLKAFWGSLGLLLGALGGLLGGSWELFGASRSTKEGLQIRLGTLLGLVCSLLAAEDGLGSVLGLSLARFGCSRGPFKGCFGIRQAVCDHQNCLSELRNLMVLVPDVVVAVVLVVVLVVIFVVALFFCHFSSARPGGMREAIE